VKKVVLIGFMGTGKSSVGRRLAKELGSRFIDTDQEIETQEGMSIAAIFSEKGEPHFRVLESEMAKTLGQESGCVIATGGGMPLNPANLDALGGVRIVLTATPEVILMRTQHHADVRPLLRGSDPLSSIRKLLAEREEVYHRCADGVIDTSHLSIGETVRRVQEKVIQIEANQAGDGDAHSG
jgi:shikimate kinase